MTSNSPASAAVGPRHPMPHVVAAVPTGPSACPEDDGQAELDHRLLAAVRDGAWLDEQKFDPLVYAVEGLIPEGFCLLVGPPKAGKSWLTLGLLLAVSSLNGYALGSISTGRARRVLYLALEDGDRRMQDRCRVLLGEGVGIPEMFHYMTRILPGMAVATIEAFLRQHPDTGLVVIDTLGKVMPAAMQGESAYQRDYRVGGALKRVADDHPGLAVVVLHHDRKAGSEDFVDSVSGTNGLAGAADTIIVLARARQSTDGLLMVTGRDVEESEYALTMVDAAWSLDGSDLATASKNAVARRETGTMSDRTAEILGFVRDHAEGINAAAVVEAVDGVDQDQARVYLSRLEKAGKIAKVKRGVYGPLPTDPSSNPVSSVSTVTPAGVTTPRTKQRNVNNTAGETTLAFESGNGTPSWLGEPESPCESEEDF